MKGSKRVFALIAGAAVFVGVLYTLGFSKTMDALSHAHFGWVSLTLAAFAAGCAIRLYKWLLMRDRIGARASLREMNGMFFFSKFWGLVSPMRSGEVAPALFRGGDDPQRGKILSIILYDRVLETAQSLIVFASVFVLLYGRFFDIRSGYALAGVCTVLGLFVFVLLSREAGHKVFAFTDGALAIFGGRKLVRSLRGFLEGVRGGMDEFYASTRSCFAPGFSLLNLLLTFVAWGFDLLFWVALFRAFSIGTDLLITVMSVVVYSMVAALAPTPGGLGISDLTFALILSRFGYSGEVGGLIILSRALVLGYTFLGYALFAPRAAAREGMG